MTRLWRFVRAILTVVGLVWLGLNLWSSLDRVGLAAALVDMTSLEPLLEVYREHMSFYYRYFEGLFWDFLRPMSEPTFYADILLNVYLIFSTMWRYSPGVLVRNWTVFAPLLSVIVLMALMAFGMGYFVFDRSVGSVPWYREAFTITVIISSIIFVLMLPLMLLQSAFSSRKDLFDALKLVGFTLGSLITVYLSSLGIAFWGIDALTAVMLVGALAVLVGLWEAILPSDSTA